MKFGICKYLISGSICRIETGQDQEDYTLLSKTFTNVKTLLGIGQKTDRNELRYLQIFNFQFHFSVRNRIGLGRMQTSVLKTFTNVKTLIRIGQKTDRNELRYLQIFNFQFHFSVRNRIGLGRMQTSVLKCTYAEKNSFFQIIKTIFLYQKACVHSANDTFLLKCLK